MNTTTITRAFRNVLASLIGYPPVIRELVTRRLEGVEGAEGVGGDAGGAGGAGSASDGGGRS